MNDLVTARTWAEIDLGALEHNYRTLRAMAGPGCRFLGLCKADGYGHGALRVGRRLEKLGADMLAVACLPEAVELRQGGITLPILCLGRTDPAFTRELLEYRVTQTVENWEDARALSDAAQALGKRLTVHLKVDTGMTRLGFLWREGREKETADTLAQVCALPGLRVEGMFTHFANADGDPEYTQLQLGRFQAARSALDARGVKIEIFHCAASAAVLNYPCTHMDMIRPGIALYGYWPDEGMAGPELRPVMSLRTRVAAVREIPAGTPVSYGCTAVLERDSRLAVLPIGYGDGLHRVLSNQMEVSFPGGSARVVGRICMDMCMADVTHLPQVHPGDVATVFGPGASLPRLAQQAGTIPYELLCAVAPRVKRVETE